MQGVPRIEIEKRIRRGGKLYIIFSFVKYIKYKKNNKPNKLRNIGQKYCKHNSLDLRRN